MKCPVCGGQDYRQAEGLYHFTECGLDWVYLEGVEHGFCPDCDDDVVELPAPEDLLALIAKWILEQKRPLHPKEIRFLRSLVGWSQDNLAVAMGLQRLAITRWESGKAQTALHRHILLKAVWLRKYLEQTVEDGCGILKTEDLRTLQDHITKIGEIIGEMRRAVPGPTRVSINVKTKTAEDISC